MADEKSSSAVATAASRPHTVAFVAVAVLLAVAIGVVVVLQRKAAERLGQSLAGLQQDVQKVRDEAEAKDRVTADLVARLEGSVSRISETLKTLSEANVKIQEELTILRGDVAAVRVRAGLPSPAAAGKGGSQTELTGISQPELMAQLASLGDRIEKLKTDVIFKETKILQDQITETKGRVDKADKDVKTLQRTVNEADLPALKSKVTEVSVEVQQAEADVKALTKAQDAFRSQVTGFFQEVFYNDPWGKYVPRGGTTAK